MFDDIEDDESSDEKSPRRKFLDREIRNHPLYKDRQYSGLIIEVARAALAVADPVDPESASLRIGLDVVDNLFHSVNEFAWEIQRQHDEPEHDGPKRHRVMWHHISRPILVQKRRGDPYIEREAAYSAASDYLHLPYRVNTLDRKLVDLLIAHEMFTYADEMQSVLRSRMPLIPKWILNNLASLVIGLGMAGFMLWLGGPSIVIGVLAAISAGLTVIAVLYSLVMFPFAYPDIRRQTKQVRDLIDAMERTYATLNGSPTSTKHLSEQVTRATEIGVIWAPALIVLIEDIRKRRETI